MSVESCSKCGSTNTFHEAKTGVTECLNCGHKWKRPTMKELMKGEVLDGFVEAQRVKPLTEFSGKYVCPYCPETFETNAELAEHIKKHLTEEPEAIVREEEIPSFSPAFLSEVEKAWKEKRSTSFWDWLMEPVENGVTVTLRGTTKPHEFFPKNIIESMVYDQKRQIYRVPKYLVSAWIQPVLEYVTRKTSEEGWVKEEDVYSEFQEKRGAPKVDIDVVLKELIREGTLYSPRPGYLRKT